METYLYIHKKSTNTSHVEYRSKYVIKHVEYVLSRETNSRGEIDSELRGGEISIVIDGFAEPAMVSWLVDPMRKECGEVVINDSFTESVSKFQFAGATLSNFRMNYDSRMKSGLSTLITIVAKEIVTDNDLNFEKR